MKFLCPNCKAKYRIGPEKMVGRQAAKIRCRKCEFLIQIAYRGSSDEFDVTATPPSIAPPPPAPVPAPRSPKTATGQPIIAPLPAPNAAPRPRAAGPIAAALKDEGSGSKKPTAAVPGLPGLGSPKSTRGAALLSDAAALPRRPLAPLPPPQVPPVAGVRLSGTLAPSAAASSPTAGSPLAAAAVQSQASAPPGATAQVASSAASRSATGSTQLGDQFRESVQAGGAADDLPQDGWFVGVNGVPLGPIPLADLRELAMAGHIDRRSLVWREGQAEWRPLGKFAGLARVIDDGAAPVATPRPEPAPPPTPAPAPTASRSNGAAANGHVATGFDVVRAEAGKPPSAWGDLDDEDDDDEQPTTVKGRVSVLPSAAAMPPVPPPPAPPPAAAPIGAPIVPPQSPANPYGLITSSVLAAPTGMNGGGPSNLISANAISAPPVASEGTGPTFAMRNAPEPVDADVGMIRSSGRSRWYLIVAAIVFAIALSVIITYLMVRPPSGSEKPGRRTSSTESLDTPSASEPTPPEPITLPPVAVDEAGTSSAAAEAEPATPSLKTKLGAAAAPAPPSPRGSSTAPSSLLAGLATSQLTGQLAVKTNDRVARLDATAIQRTVRRYSPGVRQNCWQRALNARAPGVPSSAKVSATITVDAVGRVQGVTVSGAPKGYPGLARCIESNVKSWQFPRSGGQTVTNVPFLFVGQ